MTAHRSRLMFLILLCSVTTAVAQQRSTTPPRTLEQLPNGLSFVLVPGRTCSDGQPVPGVWRKTSASMASGVPTSGPLFTQLSRIRQRQQSLLDLIKAVYPDPIGFDVIFDQTYTDKGSTALQNVAPRSYGVGVFLHELRCYQGHVYADFYDREGVNIVANELWMQPWANRDKADTTHLRSPVLQAWKHPVKIGQNAAGLTLWSAPYLDASRTQSGGSIILITHGDVQPYRMVTRKEVLDYYIGLIPEFEKKATDDLIKNFRVRPREVQDAAIEANAVNVRKRLEAGRETDIDDKVRAYKERFLYDEQVRDDTVRNAHAAYNAWLDRMRKLASSLSAEELSKMAVYDAPTFGFDRADDMRRDVPRFEINPTMQKLINGWNFFEATDELRPCSGNPCVAQRQPNAVVNPDYFDPKADSTVPQLFKVSMGWLTDDRREKNPEVKRFQDAVMNKLDYSALRALLDK